MIYRRNMMDRNSFGQYFFSNEMDVQFNVLSLGMQKPDNVQEKLHSNYHTAAEE